MAADVEVSLGEPHFEWDKVPVTYAMPTNPMPMTWGDLQQSVALNVGNPHVVFFVDNAKEHDLDELGPRIEHDPDLSRTASTSTLAEVHPEGLRLAPGSVERDHAGLRHRRQRHRRRCDPDQARPVAGKGNHAQGARWTIAWEPGQPIRMRGGATYVFKGEIDLETLGERRDDYARLPF